MLFLILFLLAAIPYFYYLFEMHELSSPELVKTLHLPPVSIVINAYKEKNIEERIKNVLHSNYKGEIIIYVLNDGHDLETEKICKKYPINVINFDERLGKTNCMNYYINRSNTEYIIFTDADVINDKDTFRNLIYALQKRSVGAVCGDVYAVTTLKNSPEKFESCYRNIYGKMCLVDVANTGSTYNFNGQIMALKKSVVKRISLRGADDANVAIECINNGFQAVYVPEAVVYEPQPKTIKAQIKQKVRRANGLITSTLHVKGFFMRKYMLLVSPLLILAGLITLFVECWWIGLILLALSAIIVIFTPNNLLSSFIMNQVCLIIGLINRKNITMWKPIDKSGGKQ